ncbi:MULTISPECIES: DUF3108 domain-containing protein [Rhizobium/Agrobacterium group]|jgi:hypothetical protein|uniref:DUF3108 domain-containing protein n=2 Tax=Rhizobium/Agrobacterium group TaxID=227290 RepID=A0AAJ4N5J4_AGRTU|nr:MULTISPECIES: DUF3108 domain-containing protein [Rhizobium/Agrobacterium group]AHK03471.1 hypothetical protein X971_3611 [Agrobacterium tumefaciens LBA4213 (Ach5)]HCV73132.1 DUF3108 domain-containing protein [Agrobacterium sp.]ADY66781.1 hypothetical protein AGROH133_11941 [Agrobacterium tumefaciens]AYM13018.1 signal peptide protein [Agrobacterium tumefaciens]KAA3505929.1 DUF3108 domain-containing protein [Agrobacterium tumefaciens]
MIARGKSIFMAVTMAFAGVSPSLAAEARHTSEYSINLGILPIAKASFSTRMNGPNYSISGSFSSAGLASVLADISGKTTISGAKRGHRLQANTYSLVYKDGKRVRTYDVVYRNGNVTSTTVKPEPKARPDNWVNVKDGDLRSVLDPISGLIIPAGGRICPSRLPIYDGESRLDLVLSPSGTKPFKTNGFSGDAVVCKARYVPKSGYRQGRKDIEYLKSISMEIWFAKSDNMDVYAPVYAVIPTRVGQVYITATKYGG